MTVPSMPQMPAYWAEAQKTLSEADPVMAGIIGAYRGEALRGKGDAFHTLARSIVGQQISVKAADAVWAKLEARNEGRTIMDMALTLGEEEFRTCGLSRSKAIYLRALAEFFERENIAHGHWDGMEDEEVIRHITQVKGIGRWSAEMFLIFHLLRPDVFPVADLGLQKAMVQHYEVERNAEALMRHARLWRPYRSVATWYLWRSLDPLPVEY